MYFSADNVYGLVGQALSKKAVQRASDLKGRAPGKPFIILISDVSDLVLFGVHPNQATLNLLGKIWPNPVSVILPCPDNKFEYLHLGTKSLAFRIPKGKKLRELIHQTGPLFAPSANPESYPPAQTIEEAKKYFGKQVDLYINGGRITSPPSTLIRLVDGKPDILRQGTFKVPASVIK